MDALKTAVTAIAAAAVAYRNRDISKEAALSAISNHMMLWFPCDRTLAELAEAGSAYLGGTRSVYETARAFERADRHGK